MSYVAGAFALLSLYQGYQGAKSQKAGFLAQADEFDLMAYETDLTRKFNWQQRNAQTKQIKLKTLQSGLDKAAMPGVQGLKTVENIKNVPFKLKECVNLRTEKSKYYPHKENWRNFPDIVYVFIGNKETGDYHFHSKYVWHGLQRKYY